MNDNPCPDYREKLTGRVLATTVVMEEHLTNGLTVILRESGCTPEYQRLIQGFIEPVLTLLREMEVQVIQQLRREGLEEMLVADSLECQAVRLEAYADEFARLANSPQQMKLASRFRDFVAEVTNLCGNGPEKGKESIQDRTPER